MPQEIKLQLEALRDITHADSMSEVIRRSLAVYDFLWREKNKGATLILQSDDGEKKQLELL